MGQWIGRAGVEPADLDELSHGFTPELDEVSESLESVESSPNQFPLPDECDINRPTLPTPLSIGLMAAILTLSVVITFDSMVDITLSPYVSEVILDWGTTSDPRFIGFFAALIIASRNLAMTFSGIYFAWISSRIGRKPALVISLVSNIVTGFLLCFASNVWYFVCLRVVNGLTCGMYVLVRASIGEDRRIPRRCRSLSVTFIPIFFFVFVIIGAGVSGLTARIGLPRAMLWPEFVRNTRSGGLSFFFRSFGAFVPNLWCCLCNVVGLVLVCLFVNETQHDVILLSSEEEKAKYSEYLRHVEEMDRFDILKELRAKKKEEEEEEEDVKEAREAELLQPRGKIIQTDDLESLPWKKRCATFFKSEIFTKLPVLSMIMDVCLLCGGFFMLQSIPVFLAQKSDLGGLEFNQMGIAIVMALFAVVSIVTLLGLSIVFDRINPVWVLRTVTFGMVVIVFWPETYYMKLWVHDWLMWLVVIVLTVVSSIIFAVTNLAVFVVQNNSVSLASKGMYQVIDGPLSCLAEGVGPFVGLVLLGVGANVNRFPIDSHLSLIVGASFFVAIAVISFFVDPRLQRPIAEPEFDLDEAIRSLEAEAEIDLL